MPKTHLCFTALTINIVPYTTCKRKQQVIIRHKVGFDDTSGLVAYYPFNEGIAGGNNTGVTTAMMSLQIITLHTHQLALTGSMSNWVEGVPGLSDSLKFCKDGDGDKYGNVSVSVSASACEPPA